MEVYGKKDIVPMEYRCHTTECSMCYAEHWHCDPYTTAEKICEGCILIGSCSLGCEKYNDELNYQYALSQESYYEFQDEVDDSVWRD